MWIPELTSPLSSPIYCRESRSCSMVRRTVSSSAWETQPCSWTESKYSVISKEQNIHFFFFSLERQDVIFRNLCLKMSRQMMSEPIYTAVGFCTCGFCTGHRDQSGGVQGLQGDKRISARVIKDVRHNFFLICKCHFVLGFCVQTTKLLGKWTKREKYLGISSNVASEKGNLCTLQHLNTFLHHLTPPQLYCTVWFLLSSKPTRAQ